MKRRVWTALIGVVAITAVAIGGALIGSDRSSAVPAAEFVPLARSAATPELKEGLERAAQAADVDPTTVYEVSGVGSGRSQRAAFVGLDATGEAHLSLSQGFGFSLFRPESHLFKDGPMVIAEGFSGPSTDVRSVGIVGAVNGNVERVAVERNDGTVFNVSLASAPISTLRFFATFSETPTSFPAVVRAYGKTGALIEEYQSNAKPLCSNAKPDCL